MGTGTGELLFQSRGHIRAMSIDLGRCLGVAQECRHTPCTQAVGGSVAG